MSKNATWDSLVFQNELPDEIIAELPEGLRIQYDCWNRLFHREIEHYPHLIAPIIQETFQQHYSQGNYIALLTTEYILHRTTTGDNPKWDSILASAIVQICEDQYHFECFMVVNKEIIVRLLPYDLGVAKTHNSGKRIVMPTLSYQQGSEINKKKLLDYQKHFPKSFSLYFGTVSGIPEKLEGNMVLGNRTIAYQINIVNVQSFSLEEIEHKHLNILIPFLPIRYKALLQSSNIKRREKARMDLSDLLKNCTLILRRENDNGVIGETEKKDIIDFLHLVCAYLFEKDPVTMKEVNQVLFPEIKLHREVCEEQKNDR